MTHISETFNLLGPLYQFQDVVTVRTAGVSFIDVTREVARVLDARGAGVGLVTLFVRHTSASLTIQENADPSVLVDLTRSLQGLAPESADYAHNCEGPDDMPAHIKSMLTATSLSVPVAGGRMRLGTWQGIYLIEHRRAPHTREVVVHYVGDLADGRA